MNTDSRAKARLMTKAAAGLAAVTAGIWAGALVACRQELAAGSPQAYGAQRYDEAHRVKIPFERVEALTTEGQTTALKLYFGSRIDGVDLTAGSVRIHDPMYYLPAESGLGINKGRVYRGDEAQCYVVEVDGIRRNGTVWVEVSKGGYRFVPEVLPVEVQGNIDTPPVEVQFKGITQNGSPDKATTALYLELDGPGRPLLGDYSVTIFNFWDSWTYHTEQADNVAMVKITNGEPWSTGHVAHRGTASVYLHKYGVRFTPNTLNVELFPWVEGRDVDPGELPWPWDYLTQRSGARIQRSATPRRDGTPVGSLR